MKTSHKVLYWSPRIICMLAILFIGVFALDSFSPSLILGQQIVAFLMHLIPSFVLLALLFVAWKWEFIGGIIFTILGILCSPFIFMLNYRMNHSVWMSTGIILTITFPFIIVGILFIVSHFKMSNQNPAKE